MSTSSRRALIAGATGLVGGFCLRRLLECAEYRAVLALVRRQPDVSHDKLDARIVDFDRLAQSAGELPAVDDAYCCLGTTIASAGSREAFERVDLGYVQAFARLAAAAGAAQFLLVSAVGAAAGSPVFYNRVKGRAEDAVNAITDFSSVHVFRPSLLLGPRREHRAGERLAQPLARGISPLLVGPLSRYRPVQADAVAEQMIDAALQSRPGRHVHYLR